MGRPAGKPGRTSAAFAELPCLPRLPAILTHRMPGRRREERETNLSVNLYPSRATQIRPLKIALAIPQKLTRWRAVWLENHSDVVRRRTSRYDGSRTLHKPLPSLQNTTPSLRWAGSASCLIVSEGRRGLHVELELITTSNGHPTQKYIR